MKTFELNKTYEIFGDEFVFVRRTAKSIFDSNGKKYKSHVRVNPGTTESVEWIWPYGPHGVHLFAFRPEDDLEDWDDGGPEKQITCSL